MVGAETPTNSLLPSDVQLWRPEHVQLWLHAIGFERYKDRFRREKISGKQLLRLDESGLISLGLQDPIRRKKLLNSIEQLKPMHGSPILLRNLSQSALSPSSVLPGADQLLPDNSNNSSVNFSLPVQKNIQKIRRHVRGASSQTKLPTIVDSAIKSSSLVRHDHENILLWISQISTAAEQLKAIRQSSCKMNDEAEDTAEKREAEEAAKRQPENVTMFSVVLQQKKAEKKRVHWYEVLGKRNNLSPSEIAQQVKADLRFNNMRRNSRIIDTSINGDNDDDSSDDEEEVDDSEEIHKAPWIILPTNSWRVKWDVLIMLLVIYYGVLTPVNLAFGDQVNNHDVDTAFNCLFGVDIILNFFTGFRIEEGHDKGQMEVRWTAIATAYLKRWFWIDVIATIPMDQVLSLFGFQVTASFNKMARLMRGFKLIRVLKMSRIFKRLTQASASNPALLRLFKYFGALIVMWHWMGCCYWIVCNVDGFEAGGWTPDPAFQDADFSSKYAQSFFWAVSATSGVGRDINPRTLLQSIFTILVIAIGVLMYAFIVGSATTALANLDAASAEKRAKLETIYQFLQQREVDKGLQNRILDYYEYAYAHSLSGNSLMEDLHTALKVKLDLALNKKLIHNVPMFKDLSRHCVLSIISRLEPKIYLPKEFICLKGERGTEMFFIQRGRVEILIEGRSKTNRVILKEGGFFGEKSMLDNSRRQCSIQALTHCELLLLHKSQVKHLLKHYPDFAASIQKYSLGRAKLRGWPKIQSVVKTVRMVKLLGGSITFEEMFKKINSETTSATHDLLRVNGIVEKRMEKDGRTKKRIISAFRSRLSKKKTATVAPSETDAGVTAVQPLGTQLPRKREDESGQSGMKSVLP